MFKKMLQITASLAVLVVSLAATWSHVELKQANNLVNEANALVEQGTKAHQDAAPKYDALCTAIEKFPAGREDMQTQARELADIYGRVAEQFRQAAAKCDEASKKRIDADVASYFAAKSQKWAKTAEVREVLREYVLLAADPELKSIDQLNFSQSILNDLIKKLVKEESELEAAAAKIQADHPTKFK